MMRRSTPRFESATVQEATHIVPQDKPEEFEEAVHSFLNRIGW